MTTLPDEGLPVSFTRQDVWHAVKVFAAANPGEAERLGAASGYSDGGGPYWIADVVSGWFESLSQEYPLCTRAIIIEAAHRAAVKTPGIVLSSLGKELNLTHVRLRALRKERGGA